MKKCKRRNKTCFFFCLISWTCFWIWRLSVVYSTARLMNEHYPANTFYSFFMKHWCKRKTHSNGPKCLCSREKTQFGMFENSYFMQLISYILFSILNNFSALVIFQKSFHLSLWTSHNLSSGRVGWVMKNFGRITWLSGRTKGRSVISNRV